jgi:hypothetical protein
MSAWQPISTAPKDGTPILGAHNHGDGWLLCVVSWTPSDPDYPWAVDDENGWADGAIHCWQPLPEPPTDGE